MASTTTDPDGAGARKVLVRRTLISLAVVLIVSVPYVAFALASGQWAAASWTTMGGLTGLIARGEG